ncbi:GntR family transcriptional regulator [Streptomyces sp. B1866]|uniref:GntR family transcriptional regulator n=1 Tax=Streptomyces sp. B1866 TaxID=3075431 RepID=UPI002890537F|nr:GntR family transcriptional regulator [Streptomyces sp. B1866]MDT3400692.1 GntR family transcriptional regulator [Streptomyces sp. B1866]
MGTTQLASVPEPKYWHLRTVLQDALDSEFAVGEVLPNERELAARFGVARATLRQALEQLELEGRLRRRRGVGTTVAPPRTAVAVGGAARPGADSAGEDVWQPVDSTWEAPPAEVARLLGTAPDAPVHTVRRTRVGHGRPLAAELLYVPPAVLPALAAEGAESAAGAPGGPSGPARAYAALRELRRLQPAGQEQTVELGSAGAEDAKRLDRLPGAPVLVVTTRWFAGGRPAAVSVAVYRADACRLTFGDAAG